mmetsp:Transcript_48590/g.150470  ORF Transcript_48590/g.150470 Transcript_48590/m.150470 type:complete len:861 (+) Transcript_48590:58-2640(+)
MADEGIGSDGPTEATVHKMLEHMGEAGIERLKGSGAATHQGRRMPRPEDFEPPPPPDGPARRLRVIREGTGFFTYQAEDSVEIVAHTTEQSPLQLCSEGGGGGKRCLLFHVGWEGVPQGWHHAVRLMQFGEVSRFEMAVEEAWGPLGGSFEQLLEGPRPAEGSTVELELELRVRAEGFFPGSVCEGQRMPARYWIRRGPGPLRPGLLDTVEVRLAAWAAPAGVLYGDLPHVPRGETLFDTRAPAAPLRFAVGEGAVFEIMESVLLDMRPGDTARLLLEAGVSAAPGVFGEAAPDGLRSLAGNPGPLEFEVSALACEFPEDPRTALPAQLQGRVLGLREEGNARVKQGRYPRAACWYEKGLEVLKASRWEEKVKGGSELAQTFRGMKVAILTNLALCHLQGKPPAPKKAVEVCSQALEIEPANLKALFRKGKALAGLGEHAQAEEVFCHAARLDPKDAAIRRELEAARKAIGKVKTSQKSAFGGMFNKLQGFAAEGRPEVASKDDSSDRLYCLVKKPEDNPFTGSETAMGDAQKMQEEGSLEKAIWAWEAAVLERQERLDFPKCWLCWFNLARLYIDMTADPTALLCFERFVKTGDLPPPPSSLLRHVHLLRGFTVVNVGGTSQGDRIGAAVACISRWLSADSPDSAKALVARLEEEASRDDSASAVDACMALSLLGLLREEAPNDACVQVLARAASLPEAQGSLFGSPERRAPKWNALGTALARSRPKQALVAFSMALHAQPSYPRALVNAGLALSSLNCWREALASYAQAAKLLPGFLAGPLWETIGGAAQHPDVADLGLGPAVEAKDAAAVLRRCDVGKRGAAEPAPGPGLPPVGGGQSEALAQMGLTGEMPKASVLG